MHRSDRAKAERYTLAPTKVSADVRPFAKRIVSRARKQTQNAPKTIGDLAASGKKHSFLAAKLVGGRDGGTD